MSHAQRHRGQHPQDRRLFAEGELPKLREALQDYAWLLSKGYAVNASLKLVGDRFGLASRQRLLLMRSACTEAQLRRRLASEVPAAALAGKALELDGLNVLITAESALSGGYLFIGLDGCYRDLSSVHGSYKRVQETREAILLLGRTLRALEVTRARWLLDRPVSNSGRLKALLLELAGVSGWPWTVELRDSPDADLKRGGGIVATTDGAILDAASAWFNLAGFLVERFVPQGKVVDLRHRV